MIDWATAINFQAIQDEIIELTGVGLFGTAIGILALSTALGVGMAVFETFTHRYTK